MPGGLGLRRPNSKLGCSAIGEEEEEEEEEERKIKGEGRSRRRRRRRKKEKDSYSSLKISRYIPDVISSCRKLGNMVLE